MKKIFYYNILIFPCSAFAHFDEVNEVLVNEPTYLQAACVIGVIFLVFGGGIYIFLKLRRK